MNILLTLSYFSTTRSQLAFLLSCCQKLKQQLLHVTKAVGGALKMPRYLVNLVKLDPFWRNIYLESVTEY
jgi:hypothetical protein